jgi:hypothetical protein
MDKETLLRVIGIRVLFAFLIIVAASVTAGLVAGVSTLFTEDVNIIVTISLITTLVVIIILYVIRCRITLLKRISSIKDRSIEDITKEKKKLIKWYTASTLMFTAFLSLILYRLRNKLVTELTGGEVVEESTFNELLILKILVTVVLVVILLWRILKKKRIKPEMR